MKKLIFLLVPCIILASIFAPLTAQAAYDPGFDIHSQSAYLVNLDRGKVMYEKNPDEQFQPASLTKIMTAVVALEAVEDIENTMVTANPGIFDELYVLNASTAGIMPNEILSMKDLLYALMLPSACEAASIIAEHVAGSVPAFVEMMNAKAEELGCTNTTFVNAHGLDAQGQASTVRDMSTILNYALTQSSQSAKFKEISTTVKYTMAVTNKHPEERTISHTNLMLSSDVVRNGGFYRDYVKGIKTGTSDDFLNLSTMAEKDGFTYLLVTMGAPQGTSLGKLPPCSDAAKLYDWVLKNFEPKNIAEPGKKTIPNTVKVKYAKDNDSVELTSRDNVIELLPKDVDVSTVMWDTKTLPETIEAPVKKGDVIGEVELRLNDEVVQKVTVVANADVERSQLAYTLHLLKNIVTSWWFILIVVVVLILILAYIVLVVLYNKRRKKNKHTRRYK